MTCRFGKNFVIFRKWKKVVSDALHKICLNVKQINYEKKGCEV